jgi:uncharacterized membrane protein YkoI
MNRSAHLLSALLAASALVVAPLNAAGTPRENARLQSGKITKNEAQHLVLKKFPGATMKKCVLAGGKDHGVWMLDIVQAGAKEVTKVQVDGRTGQITP